MKFKSMTILLLFITASLISSGDEYKLDTKKSKLEVDGTSTLHDWTLNLKKMTAKMTGRVSESENSPFNLEKLEFKCKVEDLKSSLESMDDVMYEAMNTEKHKYIIYKLKKVDSTWEQDGKTWMQTIGDLTIHGVTKEVLMKVEIAEQSDAFQFLGSESFNMSEFGIEPPSAMFGTINSGDKITIRFDVTFIQ